MMAVFAFVALQLSVFTCGLDIHVHLPVQSSMAEAGLDAAPSTPVPSPEPLDHQCHVHAAHTFAVHGPALAAPVAVSGFAPKPEPTSLNFRQLSFFIDHPPKLLQG